MNVWTRLARAATGGLALACLAAAPGGAAATEDCAPAVLGDRVLWFNPRTGADDYRAGAVFVDEMLTAGAAAVDDRASWPVDLSPYRVLVLLYPESMFTGPQKRDLGRFVAAGGALVLVGEFAGFASYEGVFRDIHGALGLSSTWLSAAHDRLCSPAWTGTVVQPHPLTAGLTELHYAYSTDVVPSGSAAVLVRGVSGQALVVEEGGVVLLTDSNPLLDSCRNADGNRPFIRNLWTSVSEADPHADDDADGVPNGCDRCPGFDDSWDGDSDGVPDGCDRCDVVVSCAEDTTTLTGGFTYYAEEIDVALPLELREVRPHVVDSAGGALVTASGTGFTGATAVYVDGVPVAATWLDGSSMEFRAPAHAAGLAHVTVQDPGGLSDTVEGALQYVRQPLVDASGAPSVADEGGSTGGCSTAPGGGPWALLLAFLVAGARHRAPQRHM